MMACGSCSHLQWIAIPMLVLLSAFQRGYTFGSDRYTPVLAVVRDNVGSVAGPLAVLTIIAYFIRREMPAIELDERPVSP
jgi:hypothetical protein